MWEWCACLCVRCRTSRRMELQTPALHHSRLLSFLLPNPRNERNWASIHRQRTPLQTRPTWLKRTVKYDHHTPTQPRENTKKHSLCTESIFICSLHTTEIKLRLFLKQKTSINENRWNVWIAYGKETLPSDTLYANSCLWFFFYYYCDVIFVYLCTDAAEGKC